MMDIVQCGLLLLLFTSQLITEFRISKLEAKDDRGN